MRKMCLQKVFEFARIDNRICFVGSDLGFETLKEYKESLPKQFFMEGISEAHVIGMAAGLAMEGKIPYVNTIATFIARRAYEQVAVDVCMHNVPVRMIGNGGGLVYAPLGSTHLALEDISLMRNLPNMTIVCPADADEMARFMPQTIDYPGPIYIRLGKGYDPIVSKDSNGFEIGRAIHYREGNDVLILTTGITLQIAVEAVNNLKADGVEAAILHMHTVKPFDSEQFIDLCQGVEAVVTVEENVLSGGLGSAAAEILSETNLSKLKKFKRLGIPDIFPDYYGSQKDILNRLGISPEGIVGTVRDLLR